MRNFPIIADVFDICLNLYQMYRFRQISNIHCRHTVIFCILKIVVADNNLRRRKEYDCNGQGTFIRQLYYEQGKDIPAIIAVDCQVKLTHFYT